MDEALKVASRTVVPASAALAAATGIGIWLDSKYNLRQDIAQIRVRRKTAKYYERLCEIHGDSDWSFYHTLHATYGLNDLREAFLFEDRSWTYAEFRGEIGRLANKLETLGVRNRMVVGMYINNSPEFVFTWWALFKLGAIPAPVNTSISREPFKHCLRLTSAEMIITTAELFDAAADSLGPDNIDRQNAEYMDHSNLDMPCLKKILLYDYGTYPVVSNVFPDVKRNTLNQNSLPFTKNMADFPPESRPKVTPNDIHQYLFTSGTTGLPKAATWPAAYCMMTRSRTRWPMMYEKPRRFYISTPMFHGGAAYVHVFENFSFANLLGADMEIDSVFFQQHTQPLEQSS